MEEPTEDACEFCYKPHAPLAVMVAMLRQSPRADFFIYPACETCYIKSIESTSQRIIRDWPAKPTFLHKVWSTKEYAAYYAEAEEELS